MVYKYQGELRPDYMRKQLQGGEAPPIEKDEEQKTLIDLLMEVIKAREQEGKTRLAEVVE